MNASVIDELLKRGVTAGGPLVRAARHGLITQFACAIPGCARPGEFDHVATHPSDWIPTVDHFPVLAKDGGTLALKNVRLAHKVCNRVDAQSRLLAQNLIALFGAADARSVLESLETGEGRTLTIERPLDDDSPVRLRLIEGLQTELELMKT
ncbi:MAG: HNH endonuclease [Actinomycetota bacterium]|nr:HNH endonuclease [Actinomycetota bacterium]